MTYLMDDIINVEIISHRNSISGRSNAPSFLSIDTNATDTTGVSATAGSAEHVADIIIGFADICSQRRLQLVIPLAQGWYTDPSRGRSK